MRNAIVVAAMLGGCAVASTTRAPTASPSASPGPNPSPSPSAEDDHPVSAEPASCDASNDDCIWPGTWFVDAYAGVTLAHKVHGFWVVWATHDPVHADDYARYRTRVAAAADLAPGTLVFVAP